MGRCIVFCAGEAGPLPPDFTLATDDFVIACDAGLTHARALGIVPHLLMGDFDSLREALPADIETLRYPVEKDDTDSMLALREGLRRGYRRFVLLFSLGGRLDHTVANLQTLAFLREQGAQGMLVGPNDTVRLLEGPASLTLPRRTDFTLSVFAFNGDAKGVTLTGMQYPLQNATVTGSFPIGLGNHILEPIGKIELQQGCLLVITSRIN